MATYKEMMKNWWKKAKIALSIVILLAITLLGVLLFGNYSNGSRTGFVTKISHKGYLIKTWEGELNYGFFRGMTPGQSSENFWVFSVTNENIAEAIRKASESGQKVTLFYHEKFLKIALRGDTKYMVYKVEYSDDNTAPSQIQK